MQIRPVCPVCIVEREIAQVVHEDFLGGSFAVVRSRKIILENRESENSATGCESMFIHLFILFSRHSDPFTSPCFTAFAQLGWRHFPKESIVISATV